MYCNVYSSLELFLFTHRLLHQTSHHTFKYIKSLIVMEQNWFNLIRHNCSSLLSQVMASQSSSSLSTTNKKMGNNIDGRNGVSSRFESNANDMAHPSDSIINQSLYLSSSDVMASSRPNEQMLVDMKQMLQTNADVSGTDLFIDENYTQLLEPSPHLQDHIMQEHSESARNALIYIAVILGIYLIAVASIVIQYYHKYSTLDPLTAFILRRSTNESKDRSRQKNRRRRRHSSSNGFESLRSPQLEDDDDDEEEEEEVIDEESYCEGEDDEAYENEDDEDDDFDEKRVQEMTVLDVESHRQPKKSRKRLKNLFSHFQSFSNDTKNVEEIRTTPPPPPSSLQSFNDQQSINGTRSPLTRSSSLHVSEMGGIGLPSPTISTNVHHQHQYHKHNSNYNQQQASRHNNHSPQLPSKENDSPNHSGWRPSNDGEIHKFKRSSIAGLTFVASSGPLGLFKTQPKHYEETHL
ncbi:hypothetical protein BLOT_007138 [Blomia tropicalis]|nr:hypothetical protein BLOT_007138 [Blomia tropicalis]